MIRGRVFIISTGNEKLLGRQGWFSVIDVWA